MNLKIILKRSVFCIFLIILFLGNGVSGSKDLVVSLAQLPGLADSANKGALVDLVRAMDEVYTDGNIKIEIYPFRRSISNVLESRADFHLPMFENPFIPASKFPYALTTESLGNSCFVIYSHNDKQITKKMIDEALSKGGDFPYKIDSSRGMLGTLKFPLIGSDSIEQSFKKLDSKRIDALVWGQEEADHVLSQLKLKRIYRVHLYDFKEKILISKGAEGEKIDIILSDAIRKLRKTGKLQELFSKVHQPYKDWQPAQMGW